MDGNVHRAGQDDLACRAPADTLVRVTREGTEDNDDTTSREGRTVRGHDPKGPLLEEEVT